MTAFTCKRIAVRRHDKIGPYSGRGSGSGSSRRRVTPARDLAVTCRGRRHRRAFHKVRIAGEFEGPQPGAVAGRRCPRCARSTCATTPRLLRHRVQRPVGRVHRLRGERSLDHFRHLLVLDGPRAPRGRGSSDRPSMQSLTRSACASCPLCARVHRSLRLRHLRHCATALLPSPSAQRRIMGQRSDMERATRWRRICASRNGRSSLLKTRAPAAVPYRAPSGSPLLFDSQDYLSMSLTSVSGD